MVLVAETIPDPVQCDALRAMFEARKRVFVDLLKWDIAVLDGRFEVDRFDDEHAAYVIVTDTAGAHAGSARLLKTTRPHILDSLFPDLCASPPPHGRDVLEITRFCLDRRTSARERIETRNLLVSALVDFALERGVVTYTGVAEMGWLQQILAFGWQCRPLGLPRPHAGKLLGALRIDIDEHTRALLTANGIYRPAQLDHADLPAAA